MTPMVDRLQKSPRCQARNRAGKSCGCPAVKGKRVCKSHGGLDAEAPPIGPAFGSPQTALPPETAGVPQTATPPQNPDFRVLGAPRDQADAAFLKMLQQDPKAAFQIDSQMRDRAADRLKLQRDAYGMAVSRLAGVTDQASYDAALSEVQQQVAPLGVNVAEHLPPQFPGVEGLRDLRLKAMDAKDQLSFFLQESNIDADNERADRNTDSLVTDRTERRTDQRRYNEGRLDVSRDRVDAYRDKSAQGGRSSGGRSAGGNRPAAPVKVNTPAEAMKLPKGTRYTTPDGKVMVR